jgi:hypothetical protein
MKTEEELKQIAIDILADRIFTSNHINQADYDSLVNIFMPLALMHPKEKIKLMEQEPVLFYEYMSEAGPRSINGYPMFMSFHFLVQEEVDIMHKYMNALINAQKEVKI